MAAFQAAVADEVQRICAPYSQQLETLHQQIQQFSREHAELKTAITQRDSTIAQQQQQIAQLTTENTQHKTGIADCNDKLTQHDQTLSGAQIWRAAADARLTEVQAEQIRLTNARQPTEHRLQHVEHDVDQLIHEYKTLAAQADDEKTRRTETMKKKLQAMKEEYEEACTPTTTSDTSQAAAAATMAKTPTVRTAPIVNTVLAKDLEDSATAPDFVSSDDTLMTTQMKPYHAPWLEAGRYNNLVDFAMNTQNAQRPTQNTRRRIYVHNSAPTQHVSNPMQQAEPVGDKATSQHDAIRSVAGHGASSDTVASSDTPEGLPQKFAQGIPITSPQSAGSDIQVLQPKPQTTSKGKNVSFDETADEIVYDGSPSKKRKAQPAGTDVKPRKTAKAKLKPMQPLQAVSLHAAATTDDSGEGLRRPSRGDTKKKFPGMVPHNGPGRRVTSELANKENEEED